MCNYRTTELLTAAAIVPTLRMVNEYFGVGVVSGAMDGAAPELNPGRVHRRINTCSEVRHAQADASKKYTERFAHAVPYGYRFSLNGSS